MTTLGIPVGIFSYEMKLCLSFKTSRHSFAKNYYRTQMSYGMQLFNIPVLFETQQDLLLDIQI